jgi:uncharacterized protein (TIGR02145 family)
MRKFYSLLIAVLLTVNLFAQVPQKMSYQAVIRNSSDQLVTNHAVGMRISILQGSATGTAVYVETQTPSTNANGLATIEIGGGTAVTGTFAGIDWSTGVYFIKTETDPTGGTNYTITGTSQLLSVPYALFAKTSEKANELESKLQILSNSIVAGGMVGDIEGNSYNTVKIGTQIWMAENLNVGQMVSRPNELTNNSIFEKYCYDNNPENCKQFGGLYLWKELMNYSTVEGSQGLCPVGWHVPTDNDWKVLESYLGMTPTQIDLSNTFRGDKADLLIGSSGIGFNALYSGKSYNMGTWFQLINEATYWWTSTPIVSNWVWVRGLNINQEGIYRANADANGFAAPSRCIKN